MRRRRRIRSGVRVDGETTAPPVDATSITSPIAEEPRVWEQDADLAAAERGLRGLVGSGASQLRPTAAMRARDAARPTDEDLARAERDLVIVRRHWVPPEARRPPVS